MQEFFSISFVLHAIFSSDKGLQEIFFRNHPPPPPSRVKWSAPYYSKIPQRLKAKVKNANMNDLIQDIKTA